jgi:proteasome lid subunit RPN8/RPN11
MRRTEDRLPILSLPAPIRRRLVFEARSAGPREACGALVGRIGTEGTRLTDVVALANRATDGRQAYRLDPAELEPLLRTRSVVGFYHSHPDAPAVFSARDARDAWPAWWYVVIGGDGAGAARITAWRNGRPGRLEIERSGRWERGCAWPS